MGVKVMASLSREVPEKEVNTALEKVWASEKFSRKVFPGTGLRGLAGIGQRRPLNAEKRLALYEQACDLAEKFDHPRKADISFRRDFSILETIINAHPSKEKCKVQLRGKEYVLLNINHLKDKQYTYIDVSEGSGYTVKDDPRGGPSSVISPDGKNLGWVITDASGLKGWYGIIRDEYDRLASEISLLNGQKNRSKVDVDDPQIFAKSPSKPKNTTLIINNQSRPKGAIQTAPIIPSTDAELRTKLQQRKYNAWEKELTNASKQPNITGNDRATVASMQDSLATCDHTNIEATLMKAARPAQSNESAFIRQLRLRANQIRNNGQ